MTGVAFDIEGANEVRRAFRRAAGNTKDLRAAHKRVAKVVEQSSKSRAKSATRQQARAQKALLGKATAKSADLAIRNMASMPFGLGAFLGAKRYRQFPDWVGNRWDLLAGIGPYVIAEAIRDDRDEILTTFEEEIGAALRAAGLDVEIT